VPLAKVWFRQRTGKRDDGRLRGGLTNTTTEKTDTYEGVGRGGGGLARGEGRGVVGGTCGPIKTGEKAGKTRVGLNSNRERETGLVLQAEKQKGRGNHRRRMKALMVLRPIRRLNGTDQEGERECLMPESR